MKRRPLLWKALGILTVIIVVGANVSCDGPYSYTAAGVPSYCQLGGNRCGATCAQMIIQFCCDKASPAYTPSWYTGNLTDNQRYLLHQDPATSVWSGWLKDYHDAHGIGAPFKHPDAVNQAIMALKETAPGHFSVFHNTSSSALMHQVAYWMKTMDYPSATLKSGSHWVLIYGFRTDVEPTPSNTVTLETISIIEPSCGGCADPGLGGVDIPDMLAAAWYDDYWDVGAALWPGQPYHGEFVAVVEPPLTKGSVRFEKSYVGSKEEIITKEKALGSAVKHVKSRKLARHRSLSFMSKASPQDAILVEWPAKKKHYYLVPFASERQGPARSMMVLNAYTGDFRECGALCRPLDLLLEKEAVRVLLERAKIGTYDKLEARLMYAVTEWTPSHYYPFWEMVVDGKAFYVDQNREVHEELFGPDKRP